MISISGRRRKVSETTGWGGVQGGLFALSVPDPYTEHTRQHGRRAKGPAAQFRARRGCIALLAANLLATREIPLKFPLDKFGAANYDSLGELECPNGPGPP
jgi:hypothetical protein